MSTGTQTAGYDYTQMPVGDGLEDFILPNAAPVKSAEEIGAENGYRDVPPGEHVLEVVGFEKPTTDYYKVMVGGHFDTGGKLVGGRMLGFQGIKLQVKLAKADDKGATIRDFFTAAPVDPSEHDAYFNGLGLDAKPGSKGGFHANKFYHFLGALGFDIVPGQPLPADALNPSKWKGRKVMVTVAAGKGTYPDKKTGEPMPRGPQIKMFSYRRVTPGVDVAGGSPPSGQPSPAHSHATAPRPTPTAPVASAQPSKANASGLDDI